MTRTAPLGRGLMRELLRHLESEVDGRADANRRTRGKGYASCGNIYRLRCVLWRGRFCNADAKRNFEVESFSKASFGSSHGSDILPVNKGALEPN